MAALQANKKLLRKTVAAALRALPPAEIQRQCAPRSFTVLRARTLTRCATAEQVAQRLVSAPFFQQSQAVSCYLSMPAGELDTSSVVAEILRAGACTPPPPDATKTLTDYPGKTLFVPKIQSTAESKMDFLRVHDAADLATFPAGLWGIREPDAAWQGRPRQSGRCRAPPRPSPR